jgi:hypothetical protein
MTDEHVVVLGSGDATLTFSDARADGYGATLVTVVIAVGTLRATTVVPLTEWGPDLVEFFAGLAKDWRGWTEAREWWAEGIHLTCLHDGVGQVSVATRVAASGPMPLNEWTIDATFLIEPGALDHVAAQFRRLLGRD